MITQPQLDQQLNALRIETNRAIDAAVSGIDQRLQPLEAPSTPSTILNSTVNQILNSGIWYSDLAYTTAGTSGSTVSDANRKAYNWFEQTAATTALSTSNILKANGHSTFPGVSDEAIWDCVNGTICIGSHTTNYDVACPLPTDFVQPGHKYRVYIEAEYASSSVDIAGAEFYCGFWDNTGGQQKWIQGSAFTPTATVQGVAGSRTLKYKIHAKTDSGEEMLSNEITVTTAPATLSADNRIELDFSSAPGFIYFGVYRKDGSNYYKVGEVKNTIDFKFFDIQETGSSVVAVSGYPSVSDNTPKAYAQTIGFTPQVGTFAAHTLTIQVPVLYNRGNTGNGMQWFRFGLTGLVADNASRQGVIIRRISVSEGYGGWSQCPRDLQAASSPTTSMTSAPATVAPIGDPPGGGEGGPSCVTLDTMVDFINPETHETYQTAIMMVDTDERWWTICGTNALPVIGVKEGDVQQIVVLETDNGLQLKATESHRLVTSVFDTRGKAVGFIKEGDTVLTYKGGFEEARIVRREIVTGQRRVKALTLPSPHLYITNGFVSHNIKHILPE